MKRTLIIVACAFGALAWTPNADAGYKRTTMGYDSRGNPIIRVVWVADHLDFPRTIYARTVYDRRTYPTSVRRDPNTFINTSTPSLPWYRVYNPSYSAYQPEEIRD